MFGIGVESYTVGSAEFALSYAAFNREKCIPLMDNGHYHPTEVVSDKIPALLAFFPEIALHITRPIRWDSDHVVLFDDETKEICKEIVRCGGLDGRVNIALDYFDASINRISAWTVGFRNVERHCCLPCVPPCSTEGAAGHQPVYRADGAAGGAEDPALWGGLGRILPPERCAGRRRMV